MAANEVPRWKRVLRMVLIGAGALALSWGIGRFQGWSSARSAVERADALETHLSQLEARRELDRCLRSLDARNFGTAQEHLDAAHALLRRSTEEPETDFAALLEEVASTQIVAAGDFGAQRQHLQDLIDRFDQLVPRLAPSASAAPPPE